MSLNVTKYEFLIELAKEKNLSVSEVNLKKSLDGIIIYNKIKINKNLSTKRKAEVLVHEIFHFLYTNSDLINQQKINNKKRELRVRKMTVNFFISDVNLKQIWSSCSNKFQLSEELDVSENLINELFKYYEDDLKKLNIEVFSRNYY